MRICMFSSIFPPRIGGPATQCFHLCRALARTGIVPVVVTYGQIFSLTQLAGFKVYTFRERYTRTSLDKIIRWLAFPVYIFYVLKKERIDILHCHNVNVLSFIAGWIARQLDIPRVIKFAGDWVWETLSTNRLRAVDFREIYSQSFYSKLLTGIERRGLRLFNLVWTPSLFRQENVRYLLGKTARTKVIPNCLLLSGGGAKVETMNGTVTIVSANRFIPHKRMAYLVEAYAKVASSRTNLVLIGGGEPKEVDKVRVEINRRNLQGQVRLTGILSANEIYEQFRKASFYVSVSLEEGFPNVFIEAMNFGLPIIATDVGGSKELVMDGETGFLVPVNDIDQLRKRMSQLVNDASLRNDFSKNAYARSKNYNLNQRVDEFISMYRELIDQKRKMPDTVGQFQS